MDKMIKNYLLNTTRTPVKTRLDIGPPEGYIESNTGKSARQGNLRYPRVRFQSFADEARRSGFQTLGMFKGTTEALVHVSISSSSVQVSRH